MSWVYMYICKGTRDGLDFIKTDVWRNIHPKIDHSQDDSQDKPLKERRGNTQA
jgi:hypothetical protein